MTSLKQRVANRRNAQRSTGPKSGSGRGRAAVNAIKHGLTSPLEATVWGSKVSELELLLVSDGHNVAEARELARRLIEFERNVDYQRQRFLEELSGEPRKQIIPDAAKMDIEIAGQIALLRGSKQTHQIGMDRPLAREMQKLFEQVANRQIRQANRDVARELKNADRYLRRAANQLIKQLKSRGDPSNLQNEPI